MINQKYVMDYYSRAEIQEAILFSSKNREVGIMFFGKNFRRPDVLNFKADIMEFVKQGATSFHVSEEKWANPLELRSGMSKKQLDDMRVGWDLVLDIDTKIWDCAKLTAEILVEALRFFGVENISCKFSGNKGFHIAVPFEAFPPEVNGVETRLLFPDGPKIISLYLKNFVREGLSKLIMKKVDIESILKDTGKKEEEIFPNGNFDPFSVIEIDTILISSRHLYRCPYSLHEKSGLVSLPIDPEKIKNFKREMALPENVDANLKFLDAKSTKLEEAKKLIIQAFDTLKKIDKPVLSNIEKKSFIPESAIGEKFFPPCIKKILAAGLNDGRKRSLFILINFLRSVGWDFGSIEKLVWEWNSKNNPPLKQGYIAAQLRWHKQQKNKLLPPNCSNSSYYKDMGICDANKECAVFKNPVNYAFKAFKKKKLFRK